MSCPLLSLSWPSGSLTHAFIRRLHSLRFPPIMCNRSPAASRPSFFARVADAMSMLQPTLRPECCVASLVLPHIHAPWISFYTIAFFFQFSCDAPCYFHSIQYHALAREQREGNEASQPIDQMAEPIPCGSRLTPSPPEPMTECPLPCRPFTHATQVTGRGGDFCLISLRYCCAVLCDKKN